MLFFLVSRRLLVADMRSGSGGLKALRPRHAEVGVRRSVAEGVSGSPAQGHVAQSRKAAVCPSCPSSVPCREVICSNRQPKPRRAEAQGHLGSRSEIAGRVEGVLRVRVFEDSPYDGGAVELSRLSSHAAWWGVKDEVNVDVVAIASAEACSPPVSCFARVQSAVVAPCPEPADDDGVMRCCLWACAKSPLYCSARRQGSVGGELGRTRAQHQVGASRRQLLWVVGPATRGRPGGLRRRLSSLRAAVTATGNWWARSALRSARSLMMSTYSWWARTSRRVLVLVSEKRDAAVTRPFSASFAPTAAKLGGAPR